MNEFNVDNPGQNEVVDGFADTQGQTDVGSPDPGVKYDPLDADEYAKEKKEIEEEEEE